MSDANQPEFFMVFLPHYSSQRLQIPIEFVQHLVDRTSGSVLLTGPSGNSWKVELVQQNDGLFFDEGWPSFVRDHLIDIGEFLVFRYDGDLRFMVTIYDHSACEKESAFHAKCSQPVDIIIRQEGNKRERVELDTSSIDVLGETPKNSRGKSHTEACSQRHGCSEIAEQRAAKSFPTKRPFFVVHIQKSNLRGRIVHIPRKFLKEHLLSYQSKEKIVLLNKKGESQLVNIISTRSDRMFSAGWSSFARNNNLKVRDTCMFELVDKFEMQVHIIRREKLKSNACKKDAADFSKCSQPADNIAKEGKKRARAKAATSSFKLLGDSGKRMKGNWETVEQRAAKSVPTKRPFFVSRIQKYNFRSGILYVPRKFLKEHRLSYKSKEKMVLRNQKGESQSVNIISYGGDCYFCAGWRAFARNSKIRERNLCMFELVNKFEMHVRIIRHEKLKFNK